MNLSKNVKTTIQRLDMLRPGDRVLIAVSGGPDSVALLHLLADSREELSLHLEVAHVQHGLRGQEAREEARFVAALAAGFGFRFHLKDVDLPAMKSAAGKGNIEALARAERYRFFAAVARARELHKVATAHTLDDQAETVLMWMLRGAGLKGLGGMAPWQSMKLPGAKAGESVTVVRPLLESSKADVLEYLKERKIAFREDPTNRDPALLRNWIRLELLPALRLRTGQNIAARLSRQAALMRDDDGFLDRLAAERYRALQNSRGLDLGQLRCEPDALKRRILRLWLAERRGHLRGLDLVHVADIMRLIESNAPHGRVSIAGGWEAVREYDALYLERGSRGRRRVYYSYDLKVGELLRIPEAGVEVHSERVDGAVCQWPLKPWEAVFDLEKLTATLAVRNFRPGDRLRPLGMVGRKKLKDIFIDRKVPRSVRATLPLLVMGEEVLWVPGYARSELGRVLPDSSALVRIKVEFTGA